MYEIDIAQSINMCSTDTIHYNSVSCVVHFSMAHRTLHAPIPIHKDTTFM